MKRSMLALAVVLLLSGCGQRQGGEGGRTVLENKGSDTLVNVAQAWAEAYREEDPNVAIAVSGGGSGTGIAALINGTVDIANASRAMEADEVELARANGHEPVEFVVGYDALVVYVHADNPLETIATPTLAEIYGDGGALVSWTDLGVEVPGCSDQEIILVSRQNNSGTYAYFRDAVLGQERDYKLGTRDMHGSKDVVDLVENTACAIGYSGLAYATPHVKMLAIAKVEGEPGVAPGVQSAIDGSYPIARPLFMYTAGQPTGAVKAYLDWILSQEGQCIIQDKGYAPASAVSCDEAAPAETAEPATP